MRVRLKLARIQHEDTQEKLAQKLGINQATYNMLESGKRIGSLRIWKRLKKVYLLNDEEMWKIATEPLYMEEE